MTAVASGASRRRTDRDRYRSPPGAPGHPIRMRRPSVARPIRHSSTFMVVDGGEQRGVSTNQRGTLV